MITNRMVDKLNDFNLQISKLNSLANILNAIRYDSVGDEVSIEDKFNCEEILCERIEILNKLYKSIIKEMNV